MIIWHLIIVYLFLGRKEKREKKERKRKKKREKKEGKKRDREREREKNREKERERERVRGVVHHSSTTAGEPTPEVDGKSHLRLRSMGGSVTSK